MAQLNVQHVDKIYDNKVQAVFDFNLDVKDGELIVLVGPSGCGKSTTLRMIAGLEDISAGHLFLDGKDITQMEELQSLLAECSPGDEVEITLYRYSATRMNDMTFTITVKLAENKG